ncbi:hypothetical protein [Adhaeretor mobilis]|uniref:Uncharacterized protein n=1 Tax=Adhaeretor mobilis TaxID=1930276 RepID=A0A517MX26_9BACT|nr:hypothetical protein [Adhaeretor mobilis]QDS99428.1 hypothetical protein HG15A2_27510 [Adhaeretor mobilis]
MTTLAPTRHASTVLLLCCALGVVFAAACSADAQDNAAAGERDLAAKQQQLARRYERLELLAGRLAELSRGTQPQRAKLLREVVTRSRQDDLPGNFAKVVQLLEQERFSTALGSQEELHKQLKQLLDLMLQEDRDRQIESERKRIARYLKGVKKLIRQQRSIAARNEGGDSAEDLAEDQKQLSEQTGELGKEIAKSEGSNEDTQAQPGESGSPQQPGNMPGDNGEKSSSKGDQKSTDKGGDKSSDNGNPSQAAQAKEGQPKEGEPSEGQPSDGEPSESQPSEGEPSGGQSQEGKPSESEPSEGQSQQGSGESPPGEQPQQEQQPQKSPAQRAADNIQKAQQRQQQAEKKLKDAKREGALEDQRQAQRELETAKAELEKILRQLREEELQRTLVLLEARFRKMLEAEIEVYDETVRLDNSVDKAPRHEVEIAAGRLSRRQDQVVREADRALTLLREDGTSVAFPEALEQAREDMQSISLRLSDLKTSVLTQALEEDVIAALEDALAAIQKALEELREQQANQQQQQQQTGEPGEQPLVNQLAELRMIRALQSRVNKRTKSYDQIIEGEQAFEAELIEALQNLAERQERIFQATHDLHTGRNR